MSRERSRLLSDNSANQDDTIHDLFVILPTQWPPWVKRIVLFQVVAHATMASWCASAFIPAFPEMSRVLNCSISQVAHLIGAYTLMMGFGVLVWNPLADRVGRLPVMLFSLSIAVMSTCDGAMASTYSRMMMSRISQGFGICAPLSLGASYIKDMYLPKDRGKALGVWTLGVTAGPFMAPFFSGFIANRMDYTWIIWLEALLLFLLLVLEICLLPESLPYAPYFRNIKQVQDLVPQFFRFSTEPYPAYRVSLTEYERPAPFDSSKKTLAAVKYPVVWLCGLGFAVPYGYVSVSISSLFPVIYGRLYDFSQSKQGLLYLPMLIGSLLAECLTGRLSDHLVAESSRSFFSNWIFARNTNYPADSEIDKSVPEVRLILGFVGCVFSILGLSWFGLSVEYRLHWINPAIATGLAAFGVQMLTSSSFAYAIDCYPKSAKEVATVMNILRVLSSFIVLFYNARLNDAVGYSLSYFIQSVVSAVFGLGGVALLIYQGRRWR